MPYIPHTEEDRREMLAAIGVASIDDLFRELPPDLIVKGPLDIPSAMDEDRLYRHMVELSGRNLNLAEHVCFLGAGIYDRYIPSTIPAILSRGEFLSAYTPYQPELSQGSLQTIYEFQSMVAELYGMDVANASMYDGATSMAEAAIVSHGVTGRKKVAVSKAVHPHYRDVLRTYCWSMGLEVVEIDCSEGATGSLDMLDDSFASAIVQSPNFFGITEDLRRVRDESKAAGALMIVVSDPVACALLKPPGEFGADIVVGEGQPLGIAMGFGGPLLGLFACKQELVRRLPGRIVGRTTDHQGTPGFVMTLRTREQDIRREKATSNICTNEALMALAATIYMSALGTVGMQRVAESSIRNTQYAIHRLTEVGCKLRFDKRVFCEFVVQLPRPAEIVRDRLLAEGILAGLPLGPYYGDMKDCLLVAVTESRTKAEIDAFAEKLAAAIQ